MESQELTVLIDSLNLPTSVTEDLKKEYVSHHSSPEEVGTKSMVKMSSKDGRKVAIILWEDEKVTVIANSSKGSPHISTTNSPDMYFIAQKNYIDQGLEVEYEE